MIRTTRAVWLFVAALTAIRLSLLATTRSFLRRSALLDVVGSAGARLLQQRAWDRFRHSREHRVFGANEFGVRFFSPVLAAGTSLLLFYFARRLFGPTAGALDGDRFERHADFQHRCSANDDRCAVDFLLDRGDVYLLARCGKSRTPRWSWYWPVTGLLIGFGFLCKYTQSFEVISVLLVLALVPRLRRNSNVPAYIR